MALVVGARGLAGESGQEGHERTVRTRDGDRTVLPDTVVRRPLGVDRIALVLVHVVHPEAGAEGLTPDQYWPADGHELLQRRARLQVRARAPWPVDDADPAPQRRPAEHAALGDGRPGEAIDAGDRVPNVVESA